MNNIILENQNNTIINKLTNIDKLLKKMQIQMQIFNNLQIIKNKSPLRYPGGKTRACKKIEEVLLNYFDVSNINTLYSPFFGGGSFEFYMQNKYNFNIICNDKFKPLYNFWKSCKNNKQFLCNKLYKKPTILKEEFSTYRNLIMNEDDSLTQAYYYFIINRCSFSGATLSGGFSQEASKKRYTKSSIDRVNNLNLNKFTIYNQDFTHFIDVYPNTCANILFLDPPYYLGNKSKLYGKNGDMHENFDHIKLHALLTQKKYWIMTYNNCEFIRTLYKDFTIIDVNWTYGMNKSKKSSEIIILNNR
jgi:DNA adenine methylase